MFFEKEDVGFHIHDVIELQQGNIRMHNTNRNFCALSFRISANTKIIAKKETIKLKDNSICFFPAMTDYTRITSHEHMIVIHFNITNNHFNKIEAFYPADPQKYKDMFYEIYKIWSEKAIGYRYKATAVLCSILAEAYAENFSSSTSDSRIAESIKYMNENYLDPNFSVASLAALSHISEVSFRKLFKEEFGTSPKKYIINARIAYAISLIEQGYFTLTEIAEKSGFSDYKYFSTEFKRITGKSPSHHYYNFTKP